MSGMASEVRGMESAIMSRKTVNASSTEMPSEIFSPASGGSRNPTRISADSMRQGMQHGQLPTNFLIALILRCLDRLKLTGHAERKDEAGQQG